MKHGHSLASGPSSTYIAWDNMIGRCERRQDDPSTVYWRGVSICDRWRSFSNFLADMGEKPPGTTLDRIDSAKGYEPGNCRWATRTVQSRNTRLHRDNTSGVRGVSFDKSRGRWRAYIAVKQRHIHLGRFDCKEDAIEARKHGERRYWGDSKNAK